MPEATLPIEEFARAMGVDPRELQREYEEREREQLATLKRGLHAESNRRPFEARALPKGGRLAARIPEHLFFNLLYKKGFGMKERLDAQDLREVVEAFPQCKVETVADKVQVGFGSKTSPRKRGVNFGRGTMEFAK